MRIEIQPTNPTHQPNRFESLARSYFAPELPQLGEVLHCLAPHILATQGPDKTLRALSDAHTFSPRKSWELLASRGLIPTQWIDAPHRWFRWHKTHYDPQSAAQAALFASNVPQLLTVEALAWEMASRLQPFGLPTPKRVFWFLKRGAGNGEQGAEKTPRPHEPWLGFYQMLFEARTQSTNAASCEPEILLATAAYSDALRDFAIDKPSLRDPLFLAHLEDLWEIASRHQWIIRDSPALFLDGDRFLPDDVIGRSFADFSNPFTPLTALWRLGFGCAGFMRSCLVLISR